MKKTSVSSKQKVQLHAKTTMYILSSKRIQHFISGIGPCDFKKSGKMEKDGALSP